jgi:hypothetical protein
MQLSEQTTSYSVSETTILNQSDWSRAFNTSILSTVIETKSHDGEIESLLNTPEYEAILLAAQSLSIKLQISPEAATERLIETFRNIDHCWEKILLKKGAQSLLGL